MDPDTEKTRKVLANDPLSSNELLSVRAVLDAVNGERPDNSGFYVLHFSDGGYAEVYCNKIENGCMVALRGALTKQTVNFLFDFLQAGNWTMIPALENTRAIATSMGAFQQVPQGFPSSLVCDTTDQLEAFLTGGFNAWSKYRDHVVEQASKGRLG